MAKTETATIPANLAAFVAAIQSQSFGVTIGTRSGDATSRPVPVADMPVNSLLKMFTYGVQRTFNDATGGSDKTTSDKLAQVDKMIAAFLSGDIGRARAVGVSAEQAEIRSIVRGLVKKAMGADAYKVAAEADDFDETIDATFADMAEADQAAIRDAANETIAQRAAKKARLAGIKIAVKL